MNDSIVLLVSCGKRKSDYPCQAKDMYNSYRFQKLKEIAQNIGLQWFILSAKYGLLPPDQIIDPYDMCLTDCSDDYRQLWTEKVIQSLSRFSKETLFVIAANNDYSQSIAFSLINHGYRVSAPFLNKQECFVADYVQNESHITDAVEFYKELYYLADKTGGIRTFNDCSGKLYWPERGVYFIVDFNERSIISNNCPRIVRIGTHAVSLGSKTTLWHRLKTHKGTNNGSGNHRGSIFRLHVGNAIIQKEKLICNTWGIGQSASKETREQEQTIEHLVSDYIGQLGIIVLDVDGLSSATNQRAFIEKNSIALISSLNSSFNFSSVDWLGNHSPRKEISDSCLWNINYIDSHYDNSFLHVFQQFSEITINNYHIK